MNLLYPQFLFALAAIAIPIIIHLFNFQRPKKVLFTNVRFLKNVKESTSSNLKLKHLLILAARILFITFLVLAFAQPFIKSGDEATAKASKFVSFYLDNSYSMQNGQQTGTLLDAGAGIVDDLLKAFPGNTSFQFLTNNFDGKDQYFVNKEKISEALTEVKFSNTYREASTVYNRQISALNAAGANENGEIFWFSDFQKSTTGDLTDLVVDSGTVLNIVPLQAESTSNIYVDSIWLASPFFKASANNTLNVNVKNSGNTAAEKVILKLFIENIQVSTASVSLAPQSTETATFTFTSEDDGLKKCKITIEDFPVTFDNEYFFVLKNAPQIKVAHLWQDESNYIPNVFSNKSLFDIKSFNYRNIDYNYLSKADLIVVDEIVSLDVALREALNNAVKENRSIALIPAENPDVSSYNSFLVAARQGNIQTITPDTTGKASASQLAVPDLNNPFFQGVFEDLDGKNIAMPFAVNTIKVNGGERLLSSRRGNAFLSKLNKGNAKVYIFGTPLSDEYTNLHKHALFVPVMYKMAMFSLGETERLAYTFQDPAISTTVDQEGKDQVFKLVKGEFELIPEQRVMDKRLVMQLPKVNMQPGFYTLTFSGQPISTLAFNYGREESEMDYYSKDELEKIFSGRKNIRIFDPTSSNDFVENFEARTLGTPLWKYALLAALFFLLAEILLIRFWKA